MALVTSHRMLEFNRRNDVPDWPQNDDSYTSRYRPIRCRLDVLSCRKFASQFSEAIGESRNNSGLFNPQG